MEHYIKRDLGMLCKFTSNTPLENVLRPNKLLIGEKIEGFRTKVRIVISICMLINDW
jgi:hypothetical protein